MGKERRGDILLLPPASSRAGCRCIVTGHWWHVPATRAAPSWLQQGSPGDLACVALMEAIQADGLFIISAE